MRDIQTIAGTWRPAPRAHGLVARGPRELLAALAERFVAHQ